MAHSKKDAKGAKPEGWFWSKHNSGRRCFFVQQGVVFINGCLGFQVLMWEGFWLLQIYLLHLFVDLHRETFGRCFPPILMQVFGVKVW